MKKALSSQLTRKTVDLSVGDISYIDEGSGIPLLLLHGAPLTSLGFCRLIEVLRSKYRVIAPDLPGFGQSSITSDFGFTLSEYSRFIAEFATVLDLKDFVLFVNDSSACMGLHAAPELSSRVAALVVADTVSLPLEGMAKLVQWILKVIMGSSFAKKLNRNFNLLPWLVATVAPTFHPFSREIRVEMIQQFDTYKKRDLILNIFSQMGCNTEFMSDAAKRASEHFGQKPALLLFGQFDPMRFVGAISCFKKMFPHNQVAIIPMEEHFPILGSGAQVADQIDKFVSRVMR